MVEAQMNKALRRSHKPLTSAKYLQDSVADTAVVMICFQISLVTAGVLFWMLYNCNRHKGEVK